jgi:hypothetical protein
LPRDPRDPRVCLVLGYGKALLGCWASEVCLGALIHDQARIELRIPLDMPLRECAECGCMRDQCDFSATQWRKGRGESRCQDCVVPEGDGRTCRKCRQKFRDDNALEIHKRTHQERRFGCPGCGKKYRGLTDTALHFESGACSACKGKDKARRATYDIVSQQPGGSNFLVQRITDGERGGAWTPDGHNFKCRKCEKKFGTVGALMQHQQSTTCLGPGRQVNLRLGNGDSSRRVQTLRFWHGTTWKRAKAIERNGFIPSPKGRLGPGIYVAREDKARRFALDRADETGEDGGLIEVLVTFSNPKYVAYDDDAWQDEGYDACRAERTKSSRNMEWCIRSPDQIEVLRVSRV